MSAEKRELAFIALTHGSRKVILSMNNAESFATIEDAARVVDALKGGAHARASRQEALRGLRRLERWRAAALWLGWAMRAWQALPLTRS